MRGIVVALICLVSIVVSQPLPRPGLRLESCDSNGPCQYSGAGTGVHYRVKVHCGDIRCTNNGDCRCGNAEFCECKGNNGGCLCQNAQTCVCNGNNGVCSGENSLQVACGSNNGQCCARRGANFTEFKSHSGGNIISPDGSCVAIGVGPLMGILSGCVVLIVLCIAVPCIIRRRLLHSSRGFFISSTPQTRIVVTTHQVFPPMHQPVFPPPQPHFVQQPVAQPGGYGAPEPYTDHPEAPLVSPVDIMSDESRSKQKGFDLL